MTEHIGNKFHPDKPVLQQSEDSFGRVQFAQRVADIIGKRTDPSSLVIGLYAPWGDGKTSVLNFIRESLSAFPLVTCLTFNPWRFGTEDLLLKGFFDLLASALNARLATRTEQVGELIRDYSAVLKLGHTGLSDAANLAGSALASTSLETLRDRMSALLSESKVRLVILIDDIDRMDKQEIQAVFRLVKLTADFENTAYILAFDEEMVAKAVGERFSAQGEDPKAAGRQFLEKIVQVPLYLPKPKKGRLREYCFDMLNEVLEDLTIKLDQDEVNNFVPLFARGIEWSIDTPRTAARYVNAVRFSAGLLQDEVNISDLLLIEGIRIFFPALYERIRTTPEFFLGSSRRSNDRRNEKTLEETIQQTLPELDELQRAGVQRLIEGIFPRTSNTLYTNDWLNKWIRDKRIASSEYFDRYFSLAIDETDISDRKVKAFIESLSEPNEDVVEDSSLRVMMTRENAGTLIAKLRAFETMVSGPAAKELIGQLVDNASKYADPPAFMNFDKPFPQAAMLVGNLFKNIREPERTEHAVAVFATNKNLAFLAECTKWIYSDKGDEDPEKTFTTKSMEKIRRALAENIRSRAQEGWDFDDRYSLVLLYAWKNGLGDDSVKEFTTAQFTTHPEGIFPLLGMSRGNAYSMVTGVPIEADFERNAYNAVTGVANADFVAGLLETGLEAAGLSSDGNSDNDGKRGSPAVMAQRFLDIHKYVKENESNLIEVKPEEETDASSVSGQ
jgi:hypothetical protein